MVTTKYMLELDKPILFPKANISLSEGKQWFVTVTEVSKGNQVAILATYMTIITCY